MSIFIFIMAPVVFFLFMQLMFGVLFTTTTINNDFNTLKQDVFLNATAYRTNQTFQFGFNEIFYFGDVVTKILAKVQAFLNLVLRAVTPPTSIPSDVQNILFYFIYIPMYIMFGFGLYRGINPFG